MESDRFEDFVNNVANTIEGWIDNEAELEYRDIVAALEGLKYEYLKKMFEQFDKSK